MEDKVIKIKCPICGWEYLPEEIYVSILGNPKNIVRDEKGKILYHTGDSMDRRENFECWHCHTNLKVTMECKFKVEPNDWEEDKE